MKPVLRPFNGLIILLVLQAMVTNRGFSQNCNGLTATCTTSESRCTATGSIQIHASGGSGTYNYKVQGPSSSDYTSSNLITGLPGGSYTVTVKDIVSNCTFVVSNVTIAGSYVEPRFGITETDVTCQNGSDGSIAVSGLQNGRSPFVYTLVAPSPTGVGTSNSTGSFTGLIPGSYAVQMSDSCGGIQTRSISIQNYTWSINSTSVVLQSCTQYTGQILLKDSKGNFNTSGAAFNGYQYGVVNSPGDTSWNSAYSFTFDLGQNRTIALVAKDRCGLVKSASWSNTVKPSLGAGVTTVTAGCSGFNASISSPQNLNNPNYCLVDGSGNAVAGQPCNATGSFTNIPYGSYCIKVTNTCYDTVISRCFSQAQPVPSVASASVTISAYTCTDVTASVTGQQNLSSPNYCLYDASGTNAVAGQPCNANGVFTHLPYGYYTIKVTDGCTAAVLSIPFNASKRVRSVAASLTAGGYTCTTFNASLTGATNMTNQQYCLVDGSGNPISGQPCNGTGVFNNLPYGTYCINVTDGCGDTTIQRCMTVTRPVPSGGSLAYTNKTCTGFTVTLSGQSNLYNNGQYCLYDQATGNPVAGVPCNGNGIFANIPYGSYCIKTTDACSGAVLTNCFTMAAPVPSVGSVAITGATCAGFTATLTQSNMFSPSFCLYDQSGTQVGACNGNGIFNITAFGTYTIKVTDGCTGTVFTKTFTATKPVASVAAAVTISGQNCWSFNAAIAGQANLAGSHYYLKTGSGTAVTNNTNGVFNNISYGSYCIDVVSSCLDTTISRCFTVSAPATRITLTATPSCIYNTTDLAVKFDSGYAPYHIKIYDTVNNLLKDTTSNNATFVVGSLPSLITAQRYKVIAYGICNTPETTYVAATPSSVSHAYTITPKCPSSISQSGSADVQVVATTNLSGLGVSITQKNFSPVSIGYSFSSGSSYTFGNLDAAVYVLTYTFAGCSATINDTLTVPDYTFPSLERSAAYQCDNNSFSVGAAVTGGIAPFSYQVIGSTPSAPSINTPTQSNPVFTINNGVEYSLVRLRAIDACGNATLNDVSILPLANTIVTATSNCIYQGTTLSTDVIPNATYSWYKKARASSTDSILVGTGPTYTLTAMAISDTGVYVSRMSVNSGCLTKLSYFHLDGSCGGMFLLPEDVSLKGNTLESGMNLLTWEAPAPGSVNQFIIERSASPNDRFAPVGMVTVDMQQRAASYTYTDNTPPDGNNYYRLSIRHSDNSITYSNIVVLNTTRKALISVYPNPATDLLYINIGGGQEEQNYFISLFTVAGQPLYTSVQKNVRSSVITYRREPGIAPGLYFLKVSNLSTGQGNVYKIKFQ